MQLSIPNDIRERLMAHRGTVHPFRELDPRRTALLVVDMQNAFLVEGSPTQIPGARDVVPAINRLAEALRSTGGVVVWIISTYGPRSRDRAPILFDHIFRGGISDELREVLTEGAQGHSLWPQLRRDARDLLISKNRSSAFIGSGGELLGALAARSIDTVLVAGTVTSVCCESTAREASMLDFKTIMVTDANAGRSAEEDRQTYLTFLQSFGDVSSVEDTIASLHAGRDTNL